MPSVETATARDFASFVEATRAKAQARIELVQDLLQADCETYGDYVLATVAGLARPSGIVSRIDILELHLELIEFQLFPTQLFPAGTVFDRDDLFAEIANVFTARSVELISTLAAARS